jgi:hypothetical protein
MPHILQTCYARPQHGSGALVFVPRGAYWGLLLP